MYRFKALVHHVAPIDPAGVRAGARVAVDVIRGRVAARELISFVGPGDIVVARAPVDDVTLVEPVEWDDDQGRRPLSGSRLVLTVAQVAPSLIVKRGVVHGEADGAADRPILCPWAAAFELLADEDDGIVLADLAREHPWLLANGERMTHFLGQAESERAVAVVLVERMRALFGATARRTTYMDFVSWARARSGESTPQQRAELVARLAAHGVQLALAGHRLALVSAG
jgi:hypothetical protein